MPALPCARVPLGLILFLSSPGQDSFWLPAQNTLEMPDLSRVD